MAQDELIDTLVSNEQLGIGKKTSVFKLMFICLVVLVVGFLAYTFFMKAKPEQEQPALSLGQPITPPAPQPIKTAEPVLPVEQTAPAIQPNAVQTQPMQSAEFGSSSTSAPMQAQTPTQQVQAATSQPTQISVSTTIAPVTAPIQPTTTQVLQPVQKTPAAPELQLATTESVVPVVEQSLVNKKPVARKKPALKVKANKSTIAEETHTPAIPMEEGVTREEIIVIQ